MSREELALETQLLLQEATLVTQQAAVESVLEDANAPPPASEFEAAKDALLAKLRRKKEANSAQRQQLNQRRYGPQSTRQSPEMFSPRKIRALKLPVASTATASTRKKQDMLTKLKTQAIQQGALQKAKIFGYATYEAQLQHLNALELAKIRKGEEKQQEEVKRKHEEVDEEDEEDEDYDPMTEEATIDEQVDSMEDEDMEEAVNGSSTATEVATVKMTETTEEQEESVKVVRRRNRIQKNDVEEEDGNEADSEQDEKDGDELNVEMEDVADAVDAANDAEEQVVNVGEEESTNAVTAAKPKDKAAGYRSLLRAEALENHKRKRLVKGRGDNFVESEAEEDDDDDVLKIGGLGDFGFGVPQAKTQESKEAEDERNALKLREDDLDHIVDDLSDDERAQEQDLEELFRREQEDQDKQNVKEVMRNVKEGFGRNRRAFSGLHSGSGARGRFNLDELVAADGNKFEAARLGLLESDEELSDEEDGKKKKKSNADGEEDDHEEDEEAEMERMLRDRFNNQPKIYVTSSESGSDNEEEDDAKKDNGPDGDEVESDEERERQQMKLFSERARINRRMQRMKDMQRQIALENNEADPSAKNIVVMPNLLLEEDEDSQELMHLLNRTDVDSTPSQQPTSSNLSTKKPRTDRPRPKLGRFNSYGGITSASRSSSSFSRVVGQCKMFSANSTGAASSKGFVFTSFSTEKAEDGGNEDAVPHDDEAMSETRPELGKSKSWSGSKMASKRRAPGAANAAASSKKRKSGGGLFSVLSSYQCVSSTSQSQER